MNGLADKIHSIYCPFPQFRNAKIKIILEGKRKLEVVRVEVDWQHRDSLFLAIGERNRYYPLLSDRGKKSLLPSCRSVEKRSRFLEDVDAIQNPIMYIAYSIHKKFSATFVVFI